ncbi:hypothetical protein APHAL10511_003136 [Amanita phalloides]|nr:hypothetical protein APHAL10511_003136 [Amanita phalloides]
MASTTTSGKHPLSSSSRTGTFDHSASLLSKHPRHSMQDGPGIKVGVLGATGTVGQRFLTLLADHPWFVVHALGASPRSAGKPYAKAVHWKQATPIPHQVAEIVVHECKTEHFIDCQIIFSGLDADVAGDIEAAFRSAELAVFSNAKNYRRDPHVPLMVPLVNPSHLSIISQQQMMHEPPLKKGFIVTNANCSTTGLVIPLCALERAFGPIECVLVTTMQAVSGAGYPGVSSLDILDNIVPHIGGEEEKMEWETLKILGGISQSDDDGAQSFDMHATHPLRVSASCNRVPVIDGHTECVSVRFLRRPPPSPQQVREALAAFTPDVQALGCPSAPRHAIVVHEQPDRPQPRLDRYFQNGAGVSVGRVRQCQVLDIKFVVLSNNVSIGAATSSIINAELAVLKGVLPATVATMTLTHDSDSDSVRAAIFQRLHPRVYLERFVAEDVRPDGRRFDEWRDISINIGSISTANGSALVRLGHTTVVCGVKAEIATPDLDTPNDGFLVPNLDLPALCSPKFKPGPPSEEAQVLSDRLYDTLVASGGLLSLSSLCIHPGKAAWVLYVDAMCINYDGNVFDASLLAMVAALRNTRLPKPTFDEESGKTVCSRQDWIELELDPARLPVSMSFGTFDSSHVFADPTAFEEPLLDSTLSIVLGSGAGDDDIISVSQLGSSWVSSAKAKGAVDVLAVCMLAAKERKKKLVQVLAHSPL